MSQELGVLTVLSKKLKFSPLRPYRVPHEDLEL